MPIDPKFLEALSGINARYSAGSLEPSQQSYGLYGNKVNPANAAVANALLSHGSINMRGSYNPNPKPGAQGQSVISRILDVMSRPLYAAADAAIGGADAAANHQSIWDQIKSAGAGVVHGISGTEKNTWADVLQQGKDINAQKKATGDTAGYQLGQGGPLSTGEKIGGVALNIVGDPSLTANPLKTVRAFGEGSELFHLPTAVDLSRKLIGKSPTAVEPVANAAEDTTSGSTNLSAGGGPQSNSASRISSGNNLLDINQKSLANANSVADVLHAKIGEPVVHAVSHPNVVLDNEALANGQLKTAAPHLTDQGIQQAMSLHKMNRDVFNAGAPGVIKNAVKNGEDQYHALSEYKKLLPTPQDASQSIRNSALESIAPTLKSQVEHNQNWVKEAVKNGVDPQRAVQVVKDIQDGSDFKPAFEDAVKNSKVFSDAKISKAGELKGGKNFSAGVANRLSRILAPTAQEVLDGVHPTNPNAATNIKAIEQAKALNAIKRAGAASKGLSTDEQALVDEFAQKARDKINGVGGYTPSGGYNDLTQSMVWNGIRGRVANITKGGASNIRGLNERSLGILAHVEDILSNEGLHATSADGTPIRLSDALLNNSEFPDKLNSFPNRIVNEYANGSLVGATAKAEQATREAATVKPEVQKAALSVNNIFKDPALSDPVKHLLTQSTAKGVERSIVMNTGSTRAGLVGRQIFNAIVNNEKGASQAAIESAGNALKGIVSTGQIPENYKSVIDQLFARIEDTLGTDPRSLTESLKAQVSPLVPTFVVEAQARAETGWLGLMATWAGQHDVRAAVVRGLNTARTNSALWSKYWSNTFEHLTQAQRVEAMRGAQGLFQPANADVLKASNSVRNRFENLFSSSGLTEAARRGNTQAMRAGIVMDGKYGINAELKRTGSAFQFTKGEKVPDMFGNLHDYSKGTDWLNSWEVHKFGGEFTREIGRIETATFNYMAKKAILDGIVHEHGSSVASNYFNTLVKDVPFLKGVYFDPEVAQQITRVNRDLFGAAHRSSPMLRKLDNVLRMWKTGVTIYSPSHAIHNGMGDIYNNWIAGVNSTRPYAKAIKVMAASARTDYPDLERLGLFDQSTRANRLTGFGDTSSKVVVTTKDGTSLTALDIKIAAHNQGILQSVQHIEDVYNTEGGIGALKFRPFGGKLNAAAHGWVQGMDHFTRLAHFIDGVQKGKGDLNEIFNAAGQQVRKFHPDGMDLTGFERNTLRRVIPFYAWTRKAIPFTIEGMLTKPGKFMVYPKITSGINYGNAGNINPGQQFPSDQLFPSWITNSGIGPWGGPGGFLDKLTGGGQGIPSGYVTGSLSVPPIDIMQSYANSPAAGILGGLNPMIKDPLELMEGHTLDTQIPITDKAQYIADTIPAVGLLQRLTNVGPTGVTNKGQTQGVGNQAALVNFLTGLKLTNTGQYVKEAQYELHQKQTQTRSANRKNLQNFLQSLGGQ